MTQNQIEKSLSRRRQSKDVWFTRGAEAVVVVTSGQFSEYVCPLCQVPFSREDLKLLSVEHVPPRAIGGRALVLTCRACNNRAGARLDTAMVRHDRVLGFALGQTPPDKPINARIQVAEHIVTADVAATGKKVSLQVVPRAVNPLGLAAFNDAVDKHTAAGTLKVSVSLWAERYAERDLRNGWLRAAYLVAFAAFGYQYIFDPALAPVRRQLADLDGDHIRDYFYIDTSADRATRMLARVREPACLWVQMGRYIVILPPLRPKPDFYTQFDRVVLESAQKRGDLAFNERPWPQGPEHRFDTP